MVAYSCNLARPYIIPRSGVIVLRHILNQPSTLIASQDAHLRTSLHNVLYFHLSFPTCSSLELSTPMLTMDDLLPSYESATKKEPWELVARYLTSDDLCACALVCQKWVRWVARFMVLIC